MSAAQGTLETLLDPARAADIPLIEELDVASLKGVRDLGALRAAVRLRTFSVRDGAIPDIAPLAALPVLRRLLLEGKPRDLSALTGGFPALEILVLGRHHAPLAAARHPVPFVHIITSADIDLSALAGLRGTRELWLGSFNSSVYTQVGDSAVFPLLPALERLELLSRTLTTAAPLASLPTVRTVNLSQNKRLRALAGVEGHTRLEQLNVSRTSVADLGPLAGLPLRHLVADATPTRALAPLAGCPALEVLSVRGTQVEDLRPLAGLARLRVVDLYDCPARDIRPLLDLPMLERVDLTNTPAEADADAVAALVARGVQLGPPPGERPWPWFAQL